MTGVISQNKVVAKNAFTFSSTDVTQEITLPAYKGCDVLAILTNAETVNVLGSEYVKAWGWNRVTGKLIITRTIVGAWANTVADVVLIK